MAAPQCSIGGRSTRPGDLTRTFICTCEDDALALSIRREGYRIRFTPYATGIHDEASSTSITPGMDAIGRSSNALFTKKWGPYVRWNLNRVPGNFDYIKT